MLGSGQSILQYVLPCDVTPLAPGHINFFEPFHFTAGDQLEIPTGVSHISLCYKNTIEGVGEKRTNEQYAGVNSSAKRELYNTAFPVCMCRLTLGWILAKILQRY